MTPAWRQGTLGDIAVVAPSGKFDPTAGPMLPYVGMEHLVPHHRSIGGWGSSDQTSSSKTHFEAGDVLYGKLRPYLKKVAMADRPGVCSTEIIVLRPRDSISPEFLYYVCSTPRLMAYAVNNSAGTRMPRIAPRELLKAPIMIPGPEERIRIADVLTHFDRLAARLRERSAALKTLLNARRESLIVPEGTWDALPDGWQLRRLDEIVDLRLGFTKGRKLKGKTVDLPYVRAANVHNGELRLSDLREETVLATEADKWLLEEDDLLLIEGGNPEDLGRGWIWEKEIEPCLHQNSVFRGRVNVDGVVPRFLAYAITCSPARRYCEAASIQTSNIAHIGTARMAALPVALPPKEQQRSIVEELDSIRAAWMASRNESSSLIPLREGLIGSLMSGSRPIPDSYDRLLPDEDPADASPEPVTV